jgi:tubulin alpha
LKNLYTKSQLISGVEDGANIFMRSHYGTGRAIIDQITDKIRKLAENCKKVKGFLFTIAAGGGTGSGLGCLLLERLSCDFGKTPRVGFAIYPSTNICNSVLEVYNAALTNETMIEHAEACVIMDNESLYDISKNMLETERSNYSDLN